MVLQPQPHGSCSSLVHSASNGLLQHIKLLLIELIKAGWKPDSCRTIPLSYQGSPLFIPNRYSTPATKHFIWPTLCNCYLFNAYSMRFVLKRVSFMASLEKGKKGHVQLVRWCTGLHRQLDLDLNPNVEHISALLNNNTTDF